MNNMFIPIYIKITYKRQICFNRPFAHFRLDSKIIRCYTFLQELFPFNAGKVVFFHAQLKEYLLFLLLLLERIPRLTIACQPRYEPGDRTRQSRTDTMPIITEMVPIKIIILESNRKEMYKRFILFHQLYYLQGITKETSFQYLYGRSGTCLRVSWTTERKVLQILIDVLCVKSDFSYFNCVSGNCYTCQKIARQCQRRNNSHYTFYSTIVWKQFLI